MLVRVFFPAIFLLPVCRFSIFVLIDIFFYIFCSFTKVKANTVCVRSQASIYGPFWPFSQRNCQIVEEDRTILTMGAPWVVKKNTEKKDFRRQTRSGRRIFDELCEKCFEKAKYKRNNSARKIGKKLSSTSQLSKFRAQWLMEILWPTIQSI